MQSMKLNKIPQLDPDILKNKLVIENLTPEMLAKIASDDDRRGDLAPAIGEIIEEGRDTNDNLKRLYNFFEGEGRPMSHSFNISHKTSGVKLEDGITKAIKNTETNRPPTPQNQNQQNTPQPNTNTPVSPNQPRPETDAFGDPIRENY